MALLKVAALPVVGAVAVLALTAALGIEALIVLSLLGACGLLPFVNPNDFVAADVKVYAFLFLLAFGGMLIAWASRELAGRENWPLPVNSLSIGLVACLAYVLLTAMSSQPTEVPALTTPFFILPLSGLATILWLSHGEALQGLRRVAPLAIAIVVAWALAYDAGAAGCASCQEWVGTELSKTGLLGSGSRLYTSGQNSFLALFLVSFAYALLRPSRTAVAIAVLGGVTIALQASRAQYLAVLAGMLVLLAWRLGQLPSGGRLALVAVSVLVMVAVIESPVGDQAVSAYTDLQRGRGTGVYRIHLINTTKEYWTTFGQGFSLRTLELGFDVDLGLPNTLLVLGYAGGVLQLFLLAVGIWRGLRARTAVGAVIAAMLVMVLVARPSLPLLEYGHSAAMYGAILGFAASLGLARRAGWGRGATHA
ncbi:MAG TPA: hypothetical protein VFY04_09640 [Solirubrobacterales bacterium]|nr:hypothetical protein [Solirubrobacterales bacterium]